MKPKNLMTDALKGIVERLAVRDIALGALYRGNSACEYRIVSQSISLAALGKCYAGSGTIWQCKILKPYFYHW